VEHIDDDLRVAAAAMIALIADCRAHPGSAYEAERLDGDRPAGCDDDAWFNLVEHLHYDLCLRSGAMSHMLDAISDLLRGAEARANEIDEQPADNRFGLTVVARSMVEALAVNRYLLDPNLAGVERLRRYLVWRFEQLRNDRNLLESIGLDGAERDEARADAEAFATQAKQCGFDVRVGEWVPGGAHDCLLEGGVPVRLPSITALVEELMPDRPSVYRLLSFGPHGSRLGIHATVVNERIDGEVTAFEMAAPGLDAQTSVTAAMWALWSAGRDLASWCGTAVDDFDLAFVSFFDDGDASA